MADAVKVSLVDETALRRAEAVVEKQAQLLQLTHDMIIIRDTHNRITFWNESAEQVYGWSKREALGSSVHSLLKTMFPAPQAEIETLLMRDGSWTGELVHTDRSGSLIYVESRQVLQRNDQNAPIGFIEINRNITQRKQLQESLREAQSRLVSPKAIQGEPKPPIQHLQEWINQCSDSDKGIFAHVDERRKIETERKRLISQLTHTDEVLHDAHERLERTVQERTMAMTVANEMLASEVTERKQAEKDLKQALAKLNRSNEELKQFAYVASHDLQEPLRTMIGYVQLLEHQYGQELGPDAGKFISKAIDSAKRMQGLIQDILAYSHLGTEGRPFEWVSGVTLLEQVFANLRNMIETSGAVITYDTLPTVMGDVTQLTQLFQNLLSNAIKYKNTQPPHIHIGAERKNHHWVFSVRDNGIGIDPQFLERVFEVFQRLHTREEYPGTGIGLALCHKIVDRHGGRIWIESEIGKGSVFFFTIPDEEHQPL